MQAPALRPARLWPAFALAVTLACIPAQARTIRVDAGATNFENSGQSWSDPETMLGSSPFIAGTLPFQIDFGSGLVDQFCMFEDGLVGFAADCTNVPADARLEPLAADWISDSGATRLFNDGAVSYSHGNLAVDASLPLPPGSNPASFPQAARFHWNAVCVGDPLLCDANRHSFQAILINRGAGDFDLELNYDDIPAGVGTASFALGTNTFSSPGPFFSATDYDFSFRNGALVNGGGGTVPEPTAASLLAIAAAAWAMRRRRSA